MLFVQCLMVMVLFTVHSVLCVAGGLLFLINAALIGLGHAFRFVFCCSDVVSLSFDLCCD